MYITPLIKTYVVTRHRDGSNEGSQHMFSLTNKKNMILNTPHPLLSGALSNYGNDFRCPNSNNFYGKH